MTRWVVLGGAGALLALLLVQSVAAATPHSAGAGPTRSMLPDLVPASTKASPTLDLGTAAQPGSICGLNSTTCAAATAQARVQLSVAAPKGLESWPAVQVAFVIETTAFDGVYDPTEDKLPPGGSDPCVAATPTGPLCEESNGVPFFENNMATITEEIAQANPQTTVTFAMIDYQGTCDLWDDGCYLHSLFRVDVAQFTDPTSFATEATQSFKDTLLQSGYVLPYEDLADPFLHGSSITALYGAMGGGVLGWSPNTHHVIVWMGSTAPRAPGYSENMCVSSSPWTTWYTSTSGYCQTATCEPSYDFPAGPSPQCEGWIQSQDGNPDDSIAALARTSPECTDSVGGTCTIDMIDLLDTPTDPNSAGWPAGTNQGPGTSSVETDSLNILLAGCELSAATGGLWHGPAFFSCPSGQAGSLQYVSHGPILTPNTVNPTLLNAFKSISFGPIPQNIVAVGTNQPLFSFVPYGSFAVAWDPEFSTACRTPTGYSPDCPVTPTVQRTFGVATYGWNWSTNASLNQLVVGDSWTVSFNIVAAGPPYRAVPVDACTTTACGAAGSGSIDGLFTAATYTVPNETGTVVQSFPVAVVTVALGSSPLPLPTAPVAAPPLNPPALPLPIPTSIPNPVLLLAVVNTPIGSLSVQPIAAGLLTGVLTRTMVRQRAMAIAHAVPLAKPPTATSTGEPAGPQLGHME